MARIRILLVEDDARVREELTASLTQDGFEALQARTVGKARRLLAEEPDLVLLDLGLPDGDGVDFCRSLRADGSSIPVIVLTARDAARDRISGLDAGADDYVVKPFEMGEVLARIRSVLRRSRQEVAEHVFRCGDLWADSSARVAGRGDRRIAFAPREFDLLLFFLKHPGKVWTRDQLLHRVWGLRGGVGHSRTVDLHVRKVRKKIEDDPTSARFISTVWSVGYRLNEDVTE